MQISIAVAAKRGVIRRRYLARGFRWRMLHRDARISRKRASREPRGLKILDFPAISSRNIALHGIAQRVQLTERASRPAPSLPPTLVIGRKRSRIFVNGRIRRELMTAANRLGTHRAL